MLTELPLPTPIEPSGKKKSLLFNPRVADEARRVLATADPNIVSQMAHVLQQTNVDHMYVLCIVYPLFDIRVCYCYKGVTLNSNQQLKLQLNIP